MTRDQIVKWVEEAGIIPPGWGATENQWCSLERFAQLIVAAERQRKAWDATYWTAYEHDVAAAEREACAVIAHNTYEGFGVDAKGVDFVKQQIIRQIKERGQV
jgi:hypothetical protein